MKPDKGRGNCAYLQTNSHRRPNQPYNQAVDSTWNNIWKSENQIASTYLKDYNSCLLALEPSRKWSFRPKFTDLNWFVGPLRRKFPETSPIVTPLMSSQSCFALRVRYRDISAGKASLYQPTSTVAISPKLVKLSSWWIVVQLITLFNKSFSEGKFPEKL